MKKGFLYLLVLITIVSSCKKSEDLSLVPITDLYPLQAGKVFYYRLDSTVLSDDRSQLIKRSYNAKDSVESEFVDNLGRKSFRIFRYLRDTLTPIANNSNWKYNTTNYASFDVNRVEYIDNNLRFVTLTNPVKESSQWKGTQYISTSGGTSNPFAIYDDWTFRYQNVGGPFTVKKGTIQDTYDIVQNDDGNPDIAIGTDRYQTRDFSEEVYAKGVGLIYKNQLHWTYQSANSTSSAHYEIESFGIKFSLIDYK